MIDRPRRDAESQQATGTVDVMVSANTGGGEPFLQRDEMDDSDGIALVPRGGFFEGQVAVLGQTRIEGTVRGSLRGSGELVLGPQARVEGIVECDVVSCRGAIVGPVLARVRALLADGTHFEGDLDTPVVKVEGNAVWLGVAHVGPSCFRSPIPRRGKNPLQKELSRPRNG